MPASSVHVEVAMAGKPIGERELIDTGTHKRYVRRDARGRFAEIIGQGRSAGNDAQQNGQNTGDKGQRGDQAG